VNNFANFPLVPVCASQKAKNEAFCQEFIKGFAK